jgi:pyridoxal phosphate enzyme (YggS family)
MYEDLSAVISHNLGDVRRRIADAAARAGRRVDEVRLIAVTKYVGLPEVRGLIAAGCRDLGESRPQGLWEKAAALAQPTTSSVCWHLIGHLQRNKVRRTLPLVSWIHSADSLRLLEEIDNQSAALGCRPNVLLEVNVSGDATKHGLRAGEIEPLLPRLAGLAHLEVRGLMCMAAREGDLDVARRNFADLRELRDRLRAAAPPSVRLDELSMGMSSDFEVAVEEGTTMVRIGSALFEGAAS